ncbi:MAG: hypothetical protein AB1700_05145 [Bacillota bacterium]
MMDVDDFAPEHGPKALGLLPEIPRPGWIVGINLHFTWGLLSLHPTAPFQWINFAPCISRRWDSVRPMSAPALAARAMTAAAHVTVIVQVAVVSPPCPSLTV